MMVNWQHVIDLPVAHKWQQAEIREVIAAGLLGIDFVNLVQLQDKFHYHWSIAKNNLERAVDGIPNVYLLHNKATDYFICCDI